MLLHENVQFDPKAVRVGIVVDGIGRAQVFSSTFVCSVIVLLPDAQIHISFFS
jgi:hypothetical protein